MKFGQKKLRKYGLGIKKGVNKGAKFGAKALDVAQLVGAAQPELLPEIEIARAGANALEKITR